MAVPKRRSSNSRTGRRRAHKKLTPKNLTYCPRCSQAAPTHVVCPNCGFYMGRFVVDMKQAEAAEATAGGEAAE